MSTAAQEAKRPERDMPIGIVTGGPSSFSKNDRSKFASMLDAAVNRLARASARKEPNPDA